MEHNPINLYCMPPLLTTNAQDRKAAPVTTGVLDYFPLALIEVARCSKAGNDQHNPGQPLHWAKEKSTDHADCITRHLMERGTFDTDGVRHSAKVAWRALALLQTEVEAEASKGNTNAIQSTPPVPRPGSWVRVSDSEMGQAMAQGAGYLGAISSQCIASVGAAADRKQLEDGVPDASSAHEYVISSNLLVGDNE